MSGIFDPNINIKTLAIIGVGGTGTSTARIVARIIYDMQHTRKHTPKVILIDPDRVEEKNIGRQALFAPSDVGKFKAEVVGRRLNFALGLDMGWICEPVSASHHFDRYGGNVVISCVDNHEARQEINRIKGVLIGSGNHKHSGQVCIGNTDNLDLMRDNLDGRDGKYVYLPKESLLFPELLQPEPVTEQPAPSCAELVAMGEQHLLVNDWMSTVIGQYVYRLLHRQPIHAFMTYANAGEMMATRSLAICREELEVFLTE